MANKDCKWGNMEDKEKQIEEMEQYLVQSIVCSKSWKPRDIIEHLTKMIIPKDSVVISREEYEFLLKPSPSNPLTKVANEVINSFSNSKIRLVENVLNKVKEVGAIKALLEMEAMPKLFETIHNDIIKDIDELAKQFGVEIKEQGV